MVNLESFWRSTEVVITGPPRKRLWSKGYREFESHLLRRSERYLRTIADCLFYQAIFHSIKSSNQLNHFSGHFLSISSFYA